MGILHVILATTLDGFVAGPTGGLDWIIMGDDRATYMAETAREADTLLLGRKSYQGYASFWPTAASNPAASRAEKLIGGSFNAMRKIVFSSTLEHADWEGTSIMRAIEPAAIERLKLESTGGIRLDSSISVVQQLTELRLVDEYRLMVHPVVLGSGRRLFEERVDLKLKSSVTFSSGVVLQIYAPALPAR